MENVEEKTEAVNDDVNSKAPEIDTEKMMKEVFDSIFGNGGVDAMFGPSAEQRV